MSSGSEERVMLSARVPDELKSLVDMDDRPNQKVVTDALWREVGDRARQSLKRQADEKRARISELQRQITGRESELEEERKELERLESALAEYKPEELTEVDAVVDDAVKHDMTIPQTADRIQRIADEHFNGDTEACVDAIQERADERDDVDREVVR